MDLRAGMDAIRLVWSDGHVCRVARDLLTLCGWGWEAADGVVRVPADAELLVYQAAVVLSDPGHNAFGDHVQALVYLGVDRSPPNLFPVHGVLRLYLDSAGRLITEDRYSRGEWRDRA